MGASSREEVTEVYGIRPGDPIMPDVSFEYHKENGILYGKAFDNRLGCVSIIDTMQALRMSGPGWQWKCRRICGPGGSGYQGGHGDGTAGSA